jgi:hypothetical protein
MELLHGVIEDCTLPMAAVELLLAQFEKRIQVMYPNTGKSD